MSGFSRTPAVRLPASAKATARPPERFARRRKGGHYDCMRFQAGPGMLDGGAYCC